MSAFGSLLQMASPFASLIPGVGPAAAIGISAGANALGSAMQGGGLMDILKGGASGAANMASSQLIGPDTPTPPTQPIPPIESLTNQFVKLPNRTNLMSTLNDISKRYQDEVLKEYSNFTL